MSHSLAENERKQEVELVWSITFLFLILLAATFSSSQPEAALDAAVAERDAEAPPPSIRIHVDAHGTLTVEGSVGNTVDPASLKTRLQSLDSTLVSPDPDVTYGITAPLLRLIYEAGHATALDISPN